MSSTIASTRSPLPSIAIGALTAVVGAVIWAVIVEVTHYKVGYAAIGLGLLVGLGMSRAATAWRPLPVVAAALALIGCLLGDLFVDAHELAAAAGTDTAQALTDMIGNPSLAREVFKAGFQPLDAAFWAFAAYAAFRMVNGAVAAATATAATNATTTASAAPARDPRWDGIGAPWSARPAAPSAAPSTAPSAEPLP